MNKSSTIAMQRGRPMLSKVPDITIFFWVIKLLTTAMGEATSDYLVHHLNPVIAVAIGAIALAASLLLQFAVRRYVTWIYWLVVVMVAVFGTMCADALHIGLGIPYYVSTTFFAIALTVVFVTWRAVEKTLSIHSIFTRRREMFYWATVLATFALGTAAGDMTATTLHLGYLASGVLFSVLFAIPGLCYWLFGLNDIFAFWCAYVLTRPVGASFADWVSVPRSLGGLDLGKGPVAIALTVVIAALVAFLMTRRQGADNRQDASPQW